MRARGAVRLSGALTARDWADRLLFPDAVLTLPVHGELVMQPGSRGRLMLESPTAGVSAVLASAGSGTRLAPPWLTWSGDLFRDDEVLAELRLRYDAKHELLRTLKSLRLACASMRLP